MEEFFIEFWNMYGRVPEEILEVISEKISQRFPKKLSQMKFVRHSCNNFEFIPETVFMKQSLEGFRVQLLKEFERKYSKESADKLNVSLTKLLETYLDESFPVTPSRGALRGKIYHIVFLLYLFLLILISYGQKCINN